MTIQSPQENIDLIEELDAGVFSQKLARALADVALGVVTTGKKGRVTIQFDMDQIADSTQVSIDHKLTYAKPTENGKTGEENTTSTPVYVGSGGMLTILPNTNRDMFNEPHENESD